MKTDHLEQIQIRGQDTRVPAARICDRTAIITGTWLRLAQVKDEELVEGEAVEDPEQFIRSLQTSGLRADLFTFAALPPRLPRRYNYRVKWDNWAAIRLTTYEDWWTKQLPHQSRTNVRRAARRGVVVRPVAFSDDLCVGIQRIYNETPIRQGRRFWHFGRDLPTVTRLNATYLERSDFIGAFLEDRLIGFLKIVYVDGVAILLQCLAMKEHRDKRPINALIACAVERCTEREASLLVYGKYTYGRNTWCSLSEFKRRNGFVRIDFPRYYAPLTPRGRLALGVGLHQGIGNLIPGAAMAVVLKCRSAVYQLSHRYHATPLDGSTGR
jgi:hypothetical protein